MAENRVFRTTDKGFTLVELTIAIAIFSIFIGAVYGIFASVSKSTTNTEVRSEIMQKLRTSIDFMEQDIRMAGLDRFKTAGAGIEFANDFSLRFTADRNLSGDIDVPNLGDGIQEGDLENITYEWDSVNSLLKQYLPAGTADDWQPVAYNVKDFKFTYLDAEGNTISPPGNGSTKDNIRAVLVTMTVEQPAGRSGKINRTLTKRILCRNLSYE
jgi:prepilin-type N-terminal cleavage/methylation domain-containing protein